jgi:hypothetical protein
LAAVLTLALGVTALHGAAAKPNTGHVSIGDRTQAQHDLCDVSGGTFESSSSYGSFHNGHQLVKTVTTCTGGQHPQTCTNTKTDTTCTPGRLLPAGHRSGDLASADLQVMDAETPSPTATPSTQPATDTPAAVAGEASDGSSADPTTAPVTTDDAQPTTTATPTATTRGVAVDSAELSELTVDS